MNKQICPRCKQEKDSVYFYTNEHHRSKKSKLSSYCKECTREYSREWNIKRRIRLKISPKFNGTKEEQKQRNREARNRYNKKLRLLIFNYYSNNKLECACCGEKEYGFLSLDHINGGGNTHRKEIGFGTQLYCWIIKNNYPPIFQILCYNCNLSKGFLGECPHKTRVL